MFSVLECVSIEHDTALVVAAAAVAMLGMLGFFHLLLRAEESASRRKRAWLAVAALSGGLSVWATHFVAMLAYRGSVPIGFDLPFTALSALVAVAGFWVALEHGRSRLALTLRFAVVVTITVAAMHFIGMRGMIVAADIRYEMQPVLWGTATAFVLFFLARMTFCMMRSWSRIAAGAVFAVLAICSLHFTAMSATVLVPDPMLAGPDSNGLGRVWIAIAVVSVTLATLLITAVAALIDRYLVDLRGFAEATLDGLAIVRDGRIVEVNTKFERLFETCEAWLIGASPDDLLAASDGLPAHVVRDKPVEASPRRGDESRIFELAVHTIEYRGRPSDVIAVRDLTEKRRAQKHVEFLARHDMLTGLANRATLQDRLGQQVEQARASGKSFAVLALDLDRFKAVNDLFGHAEGDRVLKAVADILRECVRPGDTVVRVGGDEFVILTMPGTSAEEASRLGGTVLETFRVKMDSATDATAVGVTIGVAMFPKDGAKPETLVHAADLALYRAKVGGRGTLAFYDLDMDLETRERRRMESDLRQAVARDEMEVFYQPIHNVETSAVVGYEALLRWHHPKRGTLLPETFIPLAEETGVIIGLGEWALRQACAAASRWEPHLKVAVNISSVQFRVANLPFMVCSILKETGLAPQRLELEITETALLKDRSTTLKILGSLKALGVTIVMDDFGTGYSSLSNLRSFPFDRLKIDRSFIGAMSNDENARAIVRAVVGLGRSLELPVTAEGIETPEQYRMVVDEGCSLAQGFLFGQPAGEPRKAERKESAPLQLVSRQGS